MNRVKENPCISCTARGLQDCKDKCSQYRDYEIYGTRINVIKRFCEKLKSK